MPIRYTNKNVQHIVKKTSYITGEETGAGYNFSYLKPQNWMRSSKKQKGMPTFGEKKENDPMKETKQEGPVEEEEKLGEQYSRNKV